MTFLLILLNPYNLLAFYFAIGGLAMWGVGESYKIDYSFFSLFKIFGLPTIAFGSSWFGIKKWKNLKLLKMYFLSFLLSLILIWVTSIIYWKIIVYR